MDCRCRSTAEIAHRIGVSEVDILEAITGLIEMGLVVCCKRHLDRWIPTTEGIEALRS